MATRNLTKRFNTLRAANGSAKDVHLYNTPTGSDEKAGFGVGLVGSHSSLQESSRAFGLPPEYIDYVDLIERDEEAISDSVKKLKHLHAQRLKVSFTGGEHERDREINYLSQQIQTLLSRSEGNLKKIASVGNDGSLSTEDRICRLNIMRAYAGRLQAVSRGFKAAQRSFVLAVRGQNEFGKSFFGGAEMADIQKLDEMDEREEQAMLMEQMGKERDEEIDELVQSIAAIQGLFKELSVLVIDQGSVLDRIDYNCESVMVKTKEGRKEMEKAYNYSKNNRSIVVILCLTGLMFLLLVIIGFKFGVLSL